MARLIFDKSPCARCGGTGRYAGYGVCFSCHGAKEFLTRAGARAFDAWKAYKRRHLLVAEPMTLKAGDLIMVPSLLVSANGAMLTPKGARRVIAVERTANGVEITIPWTGHNYGGFLRVDVAAKTLTFQTDEISDGSSTLAIYRPAANADLRAALPTLGDGVKLIQDEPATATEGK